MRKMSLFIALSFLASLGLVFQNCGKHNPGTVSSARIEQQGDPVVGESYLLTRVVFSDDREVLFNQEKAESIDISLNFVDSESLKGKDGCNSFLTKVFWEPKLNPDDLKVVEFFDAMSTLKGCVPPPTVSFPVAGSFYFAADNDELQLIDVNTNILYIFSLLKDLE